MPVHDWTRVDAGVFHDFHNVWIGALRNEMNSGLLPDGFYAMSEQHAGRYITDVLTLRQPVVSELPRVTSGGVALAESPPKVRRQLSLSPAARALRKTLAIRHVSGDQLIAMVEIVSPANKDRKDHIDELLDKLEDALAHGIHLLVVDLFAPGKRDPKGIHGAIWERLGDEPEGPPPDEPLTLAAYVAGGPVKAYLEHLAIGGILPEMPLFVDPGTYVKCPLEATYQSTWRGTPPSYRAILEKPQDPPRRKRRR